MVCRLCLICGLILCSTAAFAQSRGVFRWQLQPYCNVVTVAVTQSGGVFRLEGTDDQCSADKAASAVGTAFVNLDSSIGIGLAIVAAPGGTPVHVDATIALATLGGTLPALSRHVPPNVARAGRGVTAPATSARSSRHPVRAPVAIHDRRRRWD